MFSKKPLLICSLLLIAFVLFGNALEQLDTLCCLPETYSMKLMQTQASYNPKNSSLGRDEYSSQLWADYQTGKIRTVTKGTTAKGESTTRSVWILKVSPETIVKYEEINSDCTCQKTTSKELERPCVKQSATTKVTKVALEEYRGYKIDENNQDSSVQHWVFQDESHAQDVCWFLSSTITFKSVIIQNHYYDMMHAINPGVFRLHESCPPIDKCLNNK